MRPYDSNAGGRRDLEFIELIAESHPVLRLVHRLCCARPTNGRPKRRPRASSTCSESPFHFYLTSPMWGSSAEEYLVTRAAVNQTNGAPGRSTSDAVRIPPSVARQRTAGHRHLKLHCWAQAPSQFVHGPNTPKSITMRLHRVSDRVRKSRPACIPRPMDLGTRSASGGPLIVCSGGRTSQSRTDNNLQQCAECLLSRAQQSGRVRQRAEDRTDRGLATPGVG